MSGNLQGSVHMQLKQGTRQGGRDKESDRDEGEREKYGEIETDRGRQTKREHVTD